MAVGKISEFNVNTDNWELYVERLEQYFIVNKVSDDMKVPTLITTMGAESYELLVNLCTPEKPTTKKFGEITNIMMNYLQPKPSILAERYKFRHRKQNTSESIADYVAVLKKMSKTCDFEIFLEQSLRDQLVCGISSDGIRQRLFAESKLTFTRAFQLAVSMEAAERDAAMIEDQGRDKSLNSGGSKVPVECQAMAGAWRGGPTAFRSGAKGSSRSELSGTGGGAGGTAWSGTARQGGGRAATAAGATQAGGGGGRACRACGRAHATGTCKFSRYVCRVCNQQGHLRRMCPNLAGQHSVEVLRTGEVTVDDDSSDEVKYNYVQINQLSLQQCKSIVIELEVNGRKLAMECDTGSAVSCISKNIYDCYFSDLKINKCELMLRYYTGELVNPVGVIKPLVRYKDRCEKLDLYVIQNGKSVLLGRQWLYSLNIQISLEDYSNCKDLYLVEKKSPDFNLREFSSRYCNVFADGLGRFTGGTVGIHLRPDARPVYMRARPLAYALRGPVERALDELVRDGILTPVERSDWATPIVPVVKKDGNIRICADFKLTLNKMIEIDRYPIPKVDDLLVRLDGGQRFSKIDLSQAYAQFELDDSKIYTVINTHRGMFCYNRLVYGLSSSPGIFQRRLEQLFADLPRVGVFLDDVIITGRTTSEHIENLHKVFERLEKYGLKVKKDKCEFFAESITYLGYVISKEGVHTCPDKIIAISNTPPPTNVSELRAFIGMIMYYGKFVKNLSTILAPLYNLLKSGVRFEWNEACEQAFVCIKEQLTSSEVLMHYSEDLPLIVTADASSVGVGAVLSHVTPNGERPVAYASRALTKAECLYAQIDREALAIIFAIRKYHQYLYGRKFTLRTDHKPLTYIFGDKVGIPVMAAARLQRYAVILSGYTYDIEYVRSNKNCADALSRLPLNYIKNGNRKEITYLNFVEDFLPLTHDDIKKETNRDILLNRILLYVSAGWPQACPSDELKPYFDRRNELYTEGGCLMWGYRMVIPRCLRQLVLKQIHTGHLGIVKCKSMARSYVWWAGIDADIEAMCRACETCALEADAPPRTPPQPWPYSAQPWTRLHIDFLGPFMGKTYFVIIDSGSKWIELFEMKQTNATNVIAKLRETFARFGLPTEIVSDQGPPFTSEQFGDFLKRNGIRQAFSPVYHPASNGAAENAVKLCKRAIKKAYRDRVDVEAALQTYLLVYRNTVHSSTGETPAMMLQRRPLRFRLDLMRHHRAIEHRVSKAQRRQVDNAGGTERDFNLGEEVWARGYGSQEKWVKGTVLEREGSRKYVVDKGDGHLIKRHTDQIKRRSMMSDVASPIEQEQSSQVLDSSGDVPSQQPCSSRVVLTKSPNNPSNAGDTGIGEEEIVDSHPLPPVESQSVPVPPVNKPGRIRRKIIRFGIDDID